MRHDTITGPRVLGTGGLPPPFSPSLWRSVNAAAIGVAVRNGIVTLTGSVPSFMERSPAENAVERVYGVEAWPAICGIRMMTNSAGRSAANPTTTLTRPLSRSAAVVVPPSHLTK